MVPFPIGESYAGELPIANSSSEELFFWFFPSTNPLASDEIVLWLNGGPGCSKCFTFPVNPDSNLDLEYEFWRRRILFPKMNSTCQCSYLLWPWHMVIRFVMQKAPGKGIADFTTKGSLDGLLQENGPFLWQSGTSLPNLNPYSWTNLTNMVWVEYVYIFSYISISAGCGWAVKSSYEMKSMGATCHSLRVMTDWYY